MKATLRVIVATVIVDRMRSICRLVCVGLFLSPALVAAQAANGAAISGRSGERTSVNYIREHLGPPDSIRLAAVAIFRGTINWGTLRDDAEEARTKHAVDSAWALSEKRGRIGAGGITPRANAYIEYDSKSRIAYLWDRPFKMPVGDSTLVLLIDDVDRMNGGPHVTTIVIPHHAYLDEMQGKSGIAIGKAFNKLQNQWDEVLRRDPVIRDYLQ